MGINLWKSFGVSVCGPGHLATGKPNQDAWRSFHHIWGDGISVSDGLGSKPFSNVGSQIACYAVEHSFRTFRNQTKSDNGLFLENVVSNWLSRIAPLDPSDCAATCLFAVRSGDDTIHIGMLGDGLIAALNMDGSVISLSEDKSQGFSNITIALSQRTSKKDWQYLSLKEKDTDAVILCSDGVADDLENIDDFAKDFIQAHRSLSKLSAERQIRAMLENWPTPKHTDDKTIACLFREEVSDD